MNQLRRFVPVAVAVTIAGAAACGGGTGPGPQATSVTGVAGDGQTASTGATLAFPLSLVALGSSGQPAGGVHVTWSVLPVGAASFTPASSVTDVNGTASTIAKLGSFVGDISIHAAVPGVSDVVYHATAVDPCLSLIPYTFGETVTGTLASTDCRRTFNTSTGSVTFYYDLYGLSLPAGTQSIRVSMRGTSPAFDDTYMDFFRGSDGRFLAFDDDSVFGVAGARNSQLDIILPGADYIIGASSFDPFVTGPYSLTAAARPTAMNGCRQVWVLRGVSFADSITPSDCADSSATVHHYDVARILVFTGTVLSIAERSTAMNPSLALYRVNIGDNSRRLAASNDDSAGTANPNAFIRFVVDTSDVYDIIIGTSAGGETGAYTLDVLADTTLSARASAPTSRRRALWGAGGLPRPSKH
jgi:hypothetical protein